MRQGIFLPGSTFSADSLTVSVNPRVQSHALNIRTLFEDPVIHVRARGIVETLKRAAFLF